MSCGKDECILPPAVLNSSILAIVRLVKNSRQIVFMSIRLLMQAQNYLNFFSHKNLTVTKFEKQDLLPGQKRGPCPNRSGPREISYIRLYRFGLRVFHSDTGGMMFSEIISSRILQRCS